MTHSHSAADGSLPVALIGRVAGSSPRDPATLFVVDYQPQKIDGTERGARSWGMCRQFPAVADYSQDWPRKRAGFVTSNYSRTGGGLRARPAFHHLDFRAQPRWQAFVYALEGHSIHSVRSVSAGNKPSCGVSADVPKRRGELPKEKGERQDVVS